MKIGILGASGFVGKELVEQAIKQGYEVRVLVRNPSKLGQVNGSVEVIVGDLFDRKSLENFAVGIDAIVSAAGPANTSDQPKKFKRFTADLVEVMKENHITRYIYISGGALRVSGDYMSFKRGLMALMMNIMGKYVVLAKKNEIEVLENSTIEWTCVRAPMIKDCATSNHVLTSERDIIKMQISKYDIAKFMMDELRYGKWIRKAPFVAS